MKFLPSFSSVLYVLFLLPNLSWGQAQETYADEQRMQQLRRKETMLFKPVSPAEPTQDILEIVGFGLPSFSISNIADGTEESYAHHLRVSYPLQVAGGRTGYQVVFYGAGEKIPYSVVKEDASTLIYFPYQIHDQLKSRVEQALSARKKVQLKITIKPSGLREATWLIN